MLFWHVQNTAAGNGVSAAPKASDISYIRDTYFGTVYDEASQAMTATAPMSALRGELLFHLHLHRAGLVLRVMYIHVRALCIVAKMLAVDASVFSQ